MLTKRIFFIIWLFGVMSGFTLMISSNTLNFWLSKEGVNIKTIGIFALISLPYAINFLWSPIFDTKKIHTLNNLFGQRVSWLLLIQSCLAFSVYLMSLFSPSENLFMIAMCGLIISFFASAQDTILGALRTELVDKDQQGEISGMYIFGYRMGMLISGSGAIYISQYIDWDSVYKLFSLVILAFPISLILFSKDLISPYQPYKKTDALYTFKKTHQLKDLFFKIIKPIGSTKYIILVISFLILYRLPDNFIVTMINPFLLHIGYNEFEISTAGKLFGVTAAMVGGLIASHIMKTKNIHDSLFIFGAIHAIAHILFIVQEIYGNNLYLLFIVIGFESISGGMSMAAYIAFISYLCHGKFRATQYSFLSSMMGVSRSILPAISGYIVANFGWTIFYAFTTLATIPSLILIIYLKKLSDNKLKRLS
ncbi:MAG: MFS transporter [Rickettsiaceae bacterium]|nr:MFS transporter [Rickettsiaceae bacterium]